MKLIRAGCVVLLTVIPLTGFAQDNSKALADELVRSSGIKAGLCVHLGCRDGALTAELAGCGNLLVHGLDKDAAMIEKGRRSLAVRGLNGRVAIEEAAWQQPLPYPENTVNLVISDDLPGLLADGLSALEIVRVLAPNGVACIGKRAGAGGKPPAQGEFKALLTKAGLKDFEIVNSMGVWAKIKKPLNPKTDEHTHFMHDPGRNPVSNDSVVGPATQLRWLNNPPFYFDSDPGVISAQGVVFFCRLEWLPEGKRYHYILSARDAYNGHLLWRKPIKDYSPRNMAAAEGRLYLYLPNADKDILGALDIRTGETLFTVPQEALPAENAQGTIAGYVSVIDGTIVVTSRRRAPLDVYAVDAATQKRLWKQSGMISVVAGEGLVYASTADSMSAFDLKTGQEKWKISFDSLPNLAANEKTNAPEWGKLNLIHYAYGRLILFNRLKDGTQVYAVSAKDGKYLWDYKYMPAFGILPLSYPEEIWLVTSGGGRDDGFQVALDPATGKEKRRFPKLIPTSACAPLRGVRNYILGSPKSACYYLNLSTLELTGSAGFRTTCHGDGGNQTPANGLQYFIPIGCLCGPALRGVFALGADETPLAISREEPHALVKGSAAPPAAVAGSEVDWPLCRKDVKRSNATATPGPAELVKLWEGKVGEGRVSPVTVANGLAYAADVEGLQLCAFDAATGQERWRHMTGCRVDVPPAIEKGLCLFGGKDGWVYCLNAQSGQLLWRYRAAPADRRIVVSGRLESNWPVVGGVLVQNDLAYVAAGRDTGVDGGVYLHALEPATGKCVKQANLQKVRLEADWLVGDGTNVYVNGHRWVPEITETLRDHLNPIPPGVLQIDYGVSIANAIWNMEPRQIDWQRTFLYYGGKTPHGNIVANNGETSYAAGLGEVLWDRKATVEEAKQYHLISTGAVDWKLKLPLQCIALIKAGKTLYGAGIPPDRDAAQKAELWAMSAADGKILRTVPLDAWPVPDGLAVAGGRLYVALQNGKIVCFGK